MLVAAGAFRLVFVFIAARLYDQAEETARTAAAALQPKAGQGDPQAMSLWGGLTLQRAIIAARINDADTAYSELERARQMAGRLGDGHNDFNTEFGPVNVRLYEIAVAVELGDTGRAVRAAATVDTSRLSAERQGRILIDVARAHAQRRQVGAAVAALVQAEDITPELIRGHELPRQTVSDLLTMQDPPSAELRGLAERLTAGRWPGTSPSTPRRPPSTPAPSTAASRPPTAWTSCPSGTTLAATSPNVSGSAGYPSSPTCGWRPGRTCSASAATSRPRAAPTQSPSAPSAPSGPLTNASAP